MSDENLNNTALGDKTPEAGDNQNEIKVNQDGVIDYKARAEAFEKELNNKKSELEKAQYKIVDLKQKIKTDVKVNDGLEDKSGDDTDVDDKIKKAVAEEFESDRQYRIHEVLKEELDSISTNPDEKDLIKKYYENKLVKSGLDRESIKSDLTIAKAIANAPKLESVIKEINNSKNNSPESANQAKETFDSDFKKQPSANLNPAEKSLLSRYGVDPNKYQG
jgi:hypothetical protein